ncbi:MAG: RusA family crossover junction endodeoxyribonuclease [Alphaproteobacteria bacterium]|nr:RusA family crossover junction endodeoxyribonuclease [Alphaproteobacteria bacterium]MBU2269836.1 RusA family crossover junction endodeoxyribonuclease [Alphaproteobacteria bacterium]MBU2419964.1 RusA family crossover junction endodeoxyribonuclease [Alphaproteobacteria bacterium]
MTFRAFVQAGRPLTSNRNVGRNGERVMEQYRASYGQQAGEPSDAHRYGIVHYFVRDYRPAVHADAGNIAKRVWDALEGIAYDDDHVVRLQISSVIAFGPTNVNGISYTDIDLSSVPAEAFADIIGNIEDGTEHFLYVELGALEPRMFAFALGRVAAA